MNILSWLALQNFQNALLAGHSGICSICGCRSWPSWKRPFPSVTPLVQGFKVTHKLTLFGRRFSGGWTFWDGSEPTTQPQELLVTFHHLFSVWFGSATKPEKHGLPWTVGPAERMSGSNLPSSNMAVDCSHPEHRLIKLFLSVSQSSVHQNQQTGDSCSSPRLVAIHHYERPTVPYSSDSTDRTRSNLMSVLYSFQM